MATGKSGYFDLTGSNATFAVRIHWAETYEITTNKSVVTITSVQIKSTGWYEYTYYPDGVIKINGIAAINMESVSGTYSAVVRTRNEWYTILKDDEAVTGSVEVSHNTDGSKSVSIEVSGNRYSKCYFFTASGSGGSGWSVTGAEYIELTTIPRASGISGSAGTLGLEHTLTLTRYANNFTHTLAAVCGNESLIIATEAQTDSVTWAPPIGWAAQNTTGISVKVKITCTTYNGSEELGATSVTLTFVIPSTVVPTARISVSDKQGYFPKYEKYIQGKSQAQIIASGAGAYGSTIVEYSVSNGTVVKTGDLTVFDLPNVGDVKFTVIATDSRGRTASAEITISVVAYFAPTATILAAYRSDADGNQDDDGTYATVIFKANITPLDNKNSATYAVKYRVRGRSVWTTVEVTAQAGNYAPESAVQTVPIQLDSAYELAVSAADDFTETESLYRTVQVAFFLISVNRSKKSVGIGQKATESGLCAFGIPAKFNAGVNVGGKILTFAYNESIGGYVLVETEG